MLFTSRCLRDFPGVSVVQGTAESLNCISCRQTPPPEETSGPADRRAYLVSSPLIPSFTPHSNSPPAQHLLPLSRLVRLLRVRTCNVGQVLLRHSLLIFSLPSLTRGSGFHDGRRVAWAACFATFFADISAPGWHPVLRSARNFARLGRIGSSAQHSSPVINSGATACPAAKTLSRLSRRLSISSSQPRGMG